MLAAAKRFLLVAVLCFLAGSSFVSGRPTPPPSLVPAGIRIAGVEYIDAANFAIKLGWKLQSTPAPKKYHLAGRDPEVTLELDSRECAIGGQRVFLGEAVRSYRGRICLSRVDAEKLLTPVLRPGFAVKARPTVKVIALDPGHGGKDPGNANSKLKLTEKFAALDTALRLAALLKQQGYRVVMTRAGDKFIELADRPEIARRLGADLLISLHYNAAATSEARGVEVYTLTPQLQYSTGDTGRDDDAAVRISTPGNSNDHWNSLLGYSIHRELLTGLQAPDRGLKRARWAVLRPASCPAVLVESGYLSNEAEARRVATPAYRQQIAAAIARGVKSYAAALSAARVRG